MTIITKQLIAKLCHEANKSICEASGDHTQKAWGDAEQWQRDSAIAGVDYALANPNATPEDQHIAWCSDKYKDGWVWGEEKNPTTKNHPCLVEYNELPLFQRIKDHVFRAIVQSLKDSV